MLDDIGFLGLLHLIIVIWAVLHIVQSRSDPLPKALWIALVLVLPILGFIIWLFFGPRGGRT